MKKIAIPRSVQKWARIGEMFSGRPGAGHLVSAALAFFGLLAIEWWIFSQAYSERQDEINRSLQVATETSRNALRAWSDGLRTQVLWAAENPAVRAAVAAAVEEAAENPSPRGRRALADLHGTLATIPSLPHQAHPSDLFVLSSRGSIVAHEGESQPADSENGPLPVPWRAALSGIPSVGLVQGAPGHAPGANTQAALTATVAAPVRDNAGKVVAALAFNIKAREPLRDLLERSAPLGGGGVFLYSPSGGVIGTAGSSPGTPGLVQAGSGVGNHPLRAALANLVPWRDGTSADSEADAFESISVNLAGYEGLRGEVVAGAWCVLPELGVGLASEVSYDQAFHAIGRLRLILIALALVSMLCLLLVTLNRGPRPEESERTDGKRRKNSSAWAILTVSLLATVLTWITTKSSVDQHDRTRFETEVGRIRDGWLDRAQRLGETLLMLRTSSQALRPLQETEWTRFVESLTLERTFPEIGYLAYFEHQPGTPPGSLETAVRASLARDAWLRMAGRERGSFPVRYIRLTEHGPDSPTSPVSVAAREARDVGQITVSRRTTFSLPGARFDGVVILAAVFDGGAVPETLEGRRALHRGWIAAFVRVDQAMKAVVGRQSGQVTVELHDGLDLSPQTLVYDDDGMQTESDGANESRFEQNLPMRIGDRTWVLRCASTSAFDLPITKNHPAQVLLGGLAISILLFDIALIMDSTRSRALAIAELMTRRLRESETRVRAVVDNAPDGIITFSRDGIIATFNPGAQKLFGYSAAEVLGQHIESLMPACNPRELGGSDGSAKDVANPGNCREITGLPKEGNSFPVELTVSETQVGDRPMFTAIVRDISERKRAEEALRESEERYALAARAANDGLWDWDVLTDKIYFSPRWKSMLGFAEHQIGNHPAEWLDRVHTEDRARLQAELKTHLEGRSTHFEAEYRILHQDGRYRWMLSRGVAVRDEGGRALRIAGSQADITARKEAESRLLHDALYDSLTGLPNRAHFVRQLENAIQDRRARPERMFALLFLDLDRFKVVNDSLGHYVGDQLLVAIADRLKHCVRPADTIARLGGDEFAILLVNLVDVTEATLIAERIQQDLSLPFLVGQQEVFTAVSIGITISAGSDENADNLLRDADTAMYRAKAGGKGRYEMFDEGMHTRAVERLFLETTLRRALERGEFRIYYQPIVSVKTGEITACEALIRWQHPERGLVAPDEFVPLAEETGLITQISEWLLTDACNQMKQWEAAGLPPMRLSVNISPRQLKQHSVYDFVMRVLAETGVEPSMLQLELTESALMETADATIRPLVELYEKGVQIALDDFGTGYSSLIYLRRFPITSLKVDGSFVGEIASDPGDAAITAGLIALGRSLGLRVVVEGVETPEQLEFLRSQQCDDVQGFLFSRPLPAEGFAELVRSGSITEILFPAKSAPSKRHRA